MHLLFVSHFHMDILCEGKGTQRIVGCLQPQHCRNSHAIWDHNSVACHPAEVTFPPLLQPVKAGTRFSDPRGNQGWADL